MERVSYPDRIRISDLTLSEASRKLLRKIQEENSKKETESASSSISGFLRKILQNSTPSGHSAYYRGHSDSKYIPFPSIFRNKNLEEKEHIIYKEIIISNPRDFSQDITIFDKLVRMQHHALPTRLLDITSNPLIALYFAVCENFDSDGQVLIYDAENFDVKYFDSDTVSVISALAKLPWQEKSLLNLNLNRKEFNKTEEAKKLIHLIKEEKPFFDFDIDPRDLSRLYFVKAKMSNERIVSQSGAFIIFGKIDEVTNLKFQTITIFKKDKSKILSELDKLNINQSTIYPYIENSARYIRQKYESPVDASSDRSKA